MRDKKTEISNEKHYQDTEYWNNKIDDISFENDDKVKNAKEVGKFFVNLLPVFQFFTKGVQGLPLLALIISEFALIPTYIIVATVSFVISMLPIPILGTVPFFIFTIFETILAIFCVILCVISLIKAISVFEENKSTCENYKKSKTVVSIILIVVSGLYTLILPMFMVLNIIDLILSIF